uniref:Uncharacterized protein n=1 Tax=Vespula pensylvanica TaxID=30213 RepID=A0A834UF07_VESPE|nr:hypothetical protein H0235_003785 [Vespula pensylvanica]
MVRALQTISCDEMRDSSFESHGVTVDNGTLKVGPTNPAKSADAWRTLKILRAHSALCKSTVGKWVPCAKRSHSKASFWQGSNSSNGNKPPVVTKEDYYGDQEFTWILKRSTYSVPTKGHQEPGRVHSLAVPQGETRKCSTVLPTELSTSSITCGSYPREERVSVLIEEKPPWYFLLI